VWPLLFLTLIIVHVDGRGSVCSAEPAEPRDVHLLLVQVALVLLAVVKPHYRLVIIRRDHARLRGLVLLAASLLARRRHQVLDSADARHAARLDGRLALRLEVRELRLRWVLQELVDKGGILFAWRVGDTVRFFYILHGPRPALALRAASIELVIALVGVAYPRSEHLHLGRSLGGNAASVVGIVDVGRAHC